MAGLFSGIKKAKMRNQSDWAGPGHYYTRIDRVKVDKNRKGETGFFVEMTVLHVLSGAEEPFEGRTHTVGTAITHSIWAKHVDTFLPNIKAFVASTLDMDPGGIGEAEVEAIVQLEGPDAQPLSGTIVEYKGRMIKTRAGNDFTEISYRGEVGVATLRKRLAPEVVEIYFEGGSLLDQMEEWETAAPTTA